MTPRARPLVRWGLLAAPVLFLAERAWSQRWVADDGFIHLRVVSQITSGHGPVFNVGERVEASTSPMWVAVLTVTDVLTPVRLEWLAVLLGIGLTLAGVVLAIAGSIALAPARRDDDVWLPAGVAVLVAVTPIWTFASAGLEGGLAFAWLGASLWILARWARDGRELPIGAACVLGLGPLIRPELAVFVVLLLGVVLVARRADDTWRSRTRLLVAALTIPVAYEIFRMGYYGLLVPNPAVAKEASASNWHDGWRYLHETVDPYWLWVPLLVLALGAYAPRVVELRRDGRTRALLVTTAFVLGGLLVTVYVIRVGGDFLHSRLLLPPLLAVVAPVMVVPARRLYLAALLVLPWAVVATVSLRSDFDLYSKGGVGTKNPVTTDDYGWGDGGPNLAWFDGDGVYFDREKLPYEPPPDHDLIVAHYGIGLVSYAVGPDVYVLDLLGLSDPFTAHLEIDRRALAGHEKPLPAPWIAARVTAPGSDVAEDDFPLLVVGTSPLGDPDGQSFSERVERARKALMCPGLRDFFDAYRGGLSLGDFVDNLVHAVSETGRRIPPEPRDAAKEFCGS